MSDENNVIPLRTPTPPDVVATQEAPPVVVMPSDKPLGFSDLDAAFNMRDWLQKACEAAGGKKTAAGMGFGVADLWVEIEGHTFEVTIKPVTLSHS